MPQVQPMLAVGALSCLAMAAAAFSLFAMLIARQQHYTERRRAQSDFDRRKVGWDAVLDGFAQRLDSLATEVHSLQEQLPKSRGEWLGSPASRSGLNLSKRALALRMHRRGDSPEDIAAQLGVSIQEVDLLLKVQRIVLSRL